MNPAGTWLAVQLARRRATGATTMAMHRLRALAAHLVARPEPAAAAAADATPNSPRGTAEQGFGIGWADRAPSDHVQPPVFDPSTELREACEFYAENGFVVVDALSAEECAEMNATADRFLEDTGDAALQEQSGGQGQLFYPLLGSAEDIDRYSAVDKYITHPRTLPVIADVLGGAPAVSAPPPPPPTTTTHDPPHKRSEGAGLENVRFGEFNWRGYPEGFGLPRPDGSVNGGSHVRPGAAAHLPAALPCPGPRVDVADDCYVL